MPIISMFYGISVHMQCEHGGRHHAPHIHVVCGDDESVFALSGELLEGEISTGKRKLLEAWIEIHKEELESNWKLLDKG